MQEVVFKDVNIAFGGKPVIKSASFSITTGMKVGLIGENGSGKTTILRLITGEATPDNGTVSLRGSSAIWHAKQLPDDYPGQSAFDVAMDARPELAALNGRIKQFEAQFEESGDSKHHLAESGRSQLADSGMEYADVLASYNAASGYAFEAEIRRALIGLGLNEQQFTGAMEELSGGERARVFLAQAILAEPELLLLDEPDNHLDIPGLRWLEAMLLAYRGTLLLATHDRELLEKVVTATIEVEDGKVCMEQGSLDAYLARKRERTMRTKLEYSEQQRRVAKLTADIRQVESKAQKYENISTNDFQRQRAKKIAKTAVVRKAKLEKELDAEHLIEKPTERQQISVRLESVPRGGRQLLLMHDVACSFGERSLFSGVHLELKRDERIALIGPNGCGKTTLLRIILGDLLPDEGVVNRAEGASIFYCDQQHAGLNPDLSAYSQLMRDTCLTPNQVYYLLARMRLKGTAAKRPIATLSGGERTRLVLALLMNAKAQLLILDEPTNHLDMASMEILEDALRAFRGGVIFTSHDRRLVSRVATEVWAMDDERLWRR